MEDKSISFLLEKYKMLLGSEAGIRDTIIKIIEDKLGFKIDSKDVTIKNGVITIKGSSYLKNELFMQKDEILEELINKVGKRKVNRIR